MLKMERLGFKESGLGNGLSIFCLATSPYLASSCQENTVGRTTQKGFCTKNGVISQIQFPH